MTISISAIITAIITPTTANTALGTPSSSASLVSVGVVVGVLGVRVEVCDTLVVVPPASVSEGVVGATVTVTLLPVGVVEAVKTAVCVTPLLLVTGSEGVLEAVLTGICISLLSVSGSEGVVEAAMKKPASV